MKYSELTDKVSKMLNIPSETINKVYNYYWKFIKTSIQTLPLKDNLNEQEFKELFTSFNIPSLGKIAVTWTRYTGVKLRFNYTRNLKKNTNNEHKED